MPELSSFLVPQTDAGGALASGVMQGVQSGMNWAHQQSQLDIQKGQLQDQMQRTKDMHDEFRFNLGKQMTEEYQRILPLENGPYKNQLLDSFQDKYEQAGMPVHDSWTAAAKDETYNKGLGDIIADMKDTGIKDPELFKKVMRNAPQGFQQELVQDALKKNWDMAKTMTLMNARNEATDARQNKRISVGEMNQSLKMAQTATKNDQQVMGAVKRFKDTAQAVTDNSLIGSTNVLNQLTIEKSKIEQGAGQLTEGSQERARQEGIAQIFAKYESKLASAPKDAKLKPYIDQMQKEVDVVAGQYMKDVDTQHEMLRDSFGDYPQAQRALDRHFGALRSAVSSKNGLGQWDGLDKYKSKPQQDNPAPSGKQSDNSGPDPIMVREAALIKQNIDKSGWPDAKKQKAMEKWKTSYPPEVTAKVLKGSQ